MEGNDSDESVNQWLLDSKSAGHRVGLLLRDHDDQPFTYFGEVTG